MHVPWTAGRARMQTTVPLPRVNSNAFVLTDSEEEDEQEEDNVKRTNSRLMREAYDELPDVPEGLLDDLGIDDTDSPRAATDNH
jgi:hypothetical protein